MNLKISRGSTVCNFVVLFVLLSLRLLYIVSLPIDSNLLSYLTWGVSVVIYLFFFNAIQSFKAEYSHFLGRYFTYILVVQLILSIYSMVTYNETVLDMYICAGAYLLLLFAYVLILAFESDGLETVLNRVFFFYTIMLVLLLVHAFIYNNSGQSIFAFTITSIRNNRARIVTGPLTGLYCIYAFHRFLRRKEKKGLLFLILALVAIFYAEMTRANQVAIVITIAVIWLFYKDRTTSNIVRGLVVIIALFILLNSGVVDQILNMFSTDYSVNSEASSTLARYNAMEYFSQYTDENPLLGMGWVRPYTAELTRIWSGPKSAAYFDDLGFLGQFYRQGILGALIYIIFILRMFFVVVRINKENPYRAMLIGILAYVVSSMLTLNCFDGSRILGVAFYLAIFEYIYNKDGMIDYSIEEEYDEDRYLDIS